MANVNDYGAVEWLRARRVGLGPFYAAVPVLSGGVGLSFLPWVPMLMVLVGVGLAGAYWISTAQGWRRPYFGAVATLAALWVLAARMIGDSVTAWTWLLATWLLCTLVCAIPWWSDHVRRTQVDMETIVRSWPTRAERIRLSDTWFRQGSVKVTDVGWVAKLTWLPGAHTVEDIEARRTQIEGALGLRSGELTMPLDGRSTNSIQLVATIKDPHKRPILWDIPTDEVDGQLVAKRGNVKDPFLVGLRADGARKLLQLFVPDWGARQVLIGGMKGSGKSGLLNLIWAHLSLCEDVVQWGIDLKGGVELGPWEKIFDWTVHEPADAIRMLMAVNAEMMRRYAYLKARGWKKWKVDKDHPVLVVSIDEISKLLGEDVKQSTIKLVADLCRQARAAGIVLIMATQYPTVDALGSTQVREQIDQRFCFRMQGDDGETYVITDGRVNAHKIPDDRPGTCYHQDGTHVDKQTMRILFVEDGESNPPNTIEQLVSLLTGYTPVLPEDAVSVIVSEVPEYAERDNIVIENGTNENGGEMSENENETLPEWTENGDISLDRLTEMRDETLTPEQREAEREARVEREPERLPTAVARERMISALKAATTEGSQGVGWSVLMKESTRKRTWVYEELTALEEQGKVRRAAEGWVWVGELVHSV